MKKLINIKVKNLGLIEYKKAYQIQKKCAASLVGANRGVLFLCEHYPVLTAGRLFKSGNILASREEIELNNIEIINVDRGGDITLHAPGQLVFYPVINLAVIGKDLRVYLNKLEQVAIDLLDIDWERSVKEEKMLTWRFPVACLLWVISCVVWAGCVLLLFYFIQK